MSHNVNQNNRIHDFKSFGQVLRYLRKEYYPEHVLQLLPPGTSRVQLTALALIECLAKHGYSISSGAFSGLESGASLPRDPNGFLAALHKCLPMPDNDEIWKALVWHLGYDLLRRDLGEPWVGYVIPRPGSTSPDDAASKAPGVDTDAGASTANSVKP